MGDCPERCPRSHPPFYGRVVLYDSPTFVYQAIEAGTAGYILNRLMVEELNLATEALPGSLHGLTPREREIFQYLACGMSVKDIAEELVLSPYTVYTHLSTI
jgi:DNA-binding NarL/FixJ family response regulator